MQEKMKGLLVTTIHYGVFFGYGEAKANDTITLTDCRMCVYWPASVKGVLGLAVTGPLKGSRITPAAPSAIIMGVTSITEVTDEAIVNWELGLWD